MMEQAQTERVRTEEEIKIDKLTAKVATLEKIVGALAITNFLTQHEDGDEEVREQSVEAVNIWSAEYKQQWKTDKEIKALEDQKHEINRKIDNLKWGTLRFNTTNRYAVGLDQAIADTRAMRAQSLVEEAFKGGATKVVVPPHTAELMRTVGYGDSNGGK